MSRNERTALLGAALVVLVVAFVVIQGGGDGDEPAATTTPPQTQPTQAIQPAQPPAPRVERIRIRDGRPVGAPRTLEYQSGDTVRLRFSSNAASEVHIHGYDEYVQVPAGGTATARFEADAEGVFEIEEHGTGEVLAELEVSP